VTDLFKYPRTIHIEGSRLQEGDEDLDSAPFDLVAGQFVVIEEKLDGANSGISFSPEGQLLLQSRGHFLDGGARERHFNLFKTWANTHKQVLWGVLGTRYVMYGEWVYAKHTIFYDLLPHYFMEFDILDKDSRVFLSTAERHRLLERSPVVSVPVLYSGPAVSIAHLKSLIGHSLYKSSQWKDQLLEAARSKRLDADRASSETDSSDLMEGLYIKVESSNKVAGRYKYIRASFLTTVLDSGSHWINRPIVPNRLAPGVDIFGAQK